MDWCRAAGGIDDNARPLRGCDRGERVSQSTAECMPGGNGLSVDGGMWQRRWRSQHCTAESSSATSRTRGHAGRNVYADGDADGYAGGLDEDAATDADLFDADCEVRRERQGRKRPASAPDSAEPDYLLYEMR